MATVDVTLLLPSRMSSVAELEGFVNDLMVKHSLSSDVQGNLLISLTEAVTNAIRHGNRMDATKHVRVDVWRKQKKLKVLVTDQGSGFEPQSIPDPTDPAFLEQEGGRGVFLMQALTDELNYRKDGRAVEMCYRCGHSLNSVSSSSSTFAA